MSNKAIYSITLIIGLYVAAQLIADVGATRFIQVGDVVAPGGVFIFALSFTLRDLIHKRLGIVFARAAIFAAVIINALLAFYFAFIGGLPVPGFYQYGPEWTAIFALVPSVVLGSMFAELISQNIDTQVYHWLWKRHNAPQWLRVLGSNVVALPIDSLVFSLGAFVIFPSFFGGSSLELGDALLRVASGQTIYKLLVAIISTPLTYLISEEPLLEEQQKA